tara:strand:+ start:153 stop:545 length:393 start_codon:yes stop_codon:yes gene_type:complete
MNDLKPKTKKKRNDTEHKEQAKFVNMLKCLKPELNDYWFATPNGGKRDIGTAMKLKKEGVKRGIPDFIVLYPNALYCGLLIEFKRPDGKGVVSKDQKRVMAALNKVGYLCEIALTADEAWVILETYLEMK